jgi:hypothetical protein
MVIKKLPNTKLLKKEHIFTKGILSETVSFFKRSITGEIIIV